MNATDQSPEREPLLPRPTAPADEPKPLAKLPYYWPCLTTGVALNTLAVLFSVHITKSILDNPTRATYFEHNWWIVWLVGFFLLIGACASATWVAFCLHRKRHRSTGAALVLASAPCC